MPRSKNQPEGRFPIYDRERLNQNQANSSANNNRQPSPTHETKDFHALTRRVYLAGDRLSNTHADGRFFQQDKETEPVYLSLGNEPGFEKFRGLIYTRSVRDIGLIEMPGVGTKRVVSYLGPADAKDIQTVDIECPGFTMTDAENSIKWVAHFYAQLAQKLNIGFIFPNTAGKMVKGFDKTPGVSKLSPGAIQTDFNHLVNSCLYEIKTRKDNRRNWHDPLSVSLGGHSLGAPKIAGLAKDILELGQEQYRLIEGSLQAPFSLTARRELGTEKFFWAIAPYLPEIGHKAYLPLSKAPGKRYTGGQIRRHFTNSTFGTTANLELLGITTCADSIRDFSDTTLGFGPEVDFPKIVSETQKKTSKEPHYRGWSVMYPTKDAIFAGEFDNHGNRDPMLAEGVRVININSPHCPKIPIPDMALVEGYKHYLEERFGVQLETPPFEEYQEAA